MSAILIKKENSIAFICLNRADKANAYTQEMLAGIEQALKSFETENISALIFYGEGKNFCAGADKNELSSRKPEDALNLKSAQVFQQIAELPYPTIAAINGAAAGGGLELALACDLRLGTPESTYFFPEPSLGLIPAAGGCRRASILLGQSVAKQMILFGKRLNAEDALRFNLLAEIVQRDKLLARAAELARIAANHSPLANRLAKGIISAQPPDPGTAAELLSQAILYGERFALPGSKP